MQVRQVVRWTNTGGKPTSELLFHVYPNHRPDKHERNVYERTFESLRVDPATALDAEGRRITIHRVASGSTPLAFGFDAAQDTLLRVALPEPIQPGQTALVSLAYTLEIPQVQGRFGKYQGVTTLTHWHPIVAYYGANGWDAPPFIAWHQPWLHEAGNYTVTLTAPVGEVIACSGQVMQRVVDEHGRQRLVIAGMGLRDFAIIASKRFETIENRETGIPVRVYAFPEHRFYARQALKSAAESIALYQQWFGPYPYPELAVCESYFGWNGNECSGLIMIDERVFDAPHMGHVYVDHLVGHEVCHQWWYAAVGTDGYRETWMDEGLVVYFNELRVKQKYGSNPLMVDWPSGFGWMPNVEYDALLRSGYHLYLHRGGKDAVVGPLPDIKHIHNLFFLVYDRGSKVTSMLHQRLGDEQFFRLFRHIYAEYRYRVLFLCNFEHEINELTGDDWSGFFDAWLRSGKVADWKIERVNVEAANAGYTTTVTVRQRMEIDEPVEIGLHFTKDGPAVAKVLLIPEAGAYQVGDAQVTPTGAHEWTVAFHTRRPPEQVTIDPEKRILDGNLFNNRWRPAPEIRFTPLYTPVDEASFTRPFGRPSFVFGPNIDQEGRVGIRGSLIEGDIYRAAPFLSYTPEDDHWTVGLDAQWYDVPAPHFAIGIRYEHTLASDLYDEPLDQAKLYLRWHQVYTTSLIYPHLAYADLYFRVGDNFFPDEDVRPPSAPGVEDYRDVRAVGLAYQIDTQMPYWNPEKGFRFETAYEFGFHAFDGGESYNRVWGQLSGAHRLPPGLGWLSETRMAGRLAGGVGAPDNGEHFRFGGPLRFRGQRSEDTEGSLFWLTTAEWRFPLLPETDVNLLDNLGNIKSLYASVFYDVGESFLFDQSQGVDHAVGAGLYFHIALLSFVEQLTLRVEYGHSLRRDTDVVWFGLYHAY